VKRREFIAGLGTAAAWPVVAQAQQPAMPVVGYLYSGMEDPSGVGAAALREGLSESGFTEGRNVSIEYRFAGNQPDRLPELAADLVRRRVTVIAALGTSAVVAKAATTTIPIVFGTAGDPVQAGLVTSLNRPGGNLTGFSYLGQELVPKRLGLMHELLPQATHFAMLVDPTTLTAESNIKAAQTAASAIGRQIETFNAGTNSEIDTAFASLVQKGAEGVLVNGSPLFNNRRLQLATLAARHAMPVIYYDRVFAEAGGLMSYGSNILDQYRQVGAYTGRILKGEKAADLPVQLATKVELIINMKTARALALTIPETLLATADEVIQ
jgi:putative tryptophan/tyrosine transport system substrate-binding protein